MDYQSVFNYLRQVTEFIGNWGYAVFFAVALFESSAFLGLLVPSETMVILAGFLAAQGYFDVRNCIGVIILGAVLGDSMGYWLGWKLGRPYFERRRRFFLFRRKHLQKVDGYFAAHGGKTVFLGKFIHLFRALTPFVAGMSRMNYRRFLVFNIPGGVVWSTVFTLVGFFFGQSLKSVHKWTGRAGLAALFLILLFIGFEYLRRELKKEK